MLAEASPIADAPASGSWESVRERIRPTAPFNLTGLPAVSVPCGLTNSGLPVGLQIVGKHFADRMVLAAAHLFEQAIGWRTQCSGRAPVLASLEAP
jgi:Asp-tRNA(Asn)/Glu-tRNA(Gln) amidotransferase A subunit family amidase